MIIQFRDVRMLNHALIGYGWTDDNPGKWWIYAHSSIDEYAKSFKIVTGMMFKYLPLLLIFSYALTLTKDINVYCMHWWLR